MSNFLVQSRRSGDSIQITIPASIVKCYDIKELDFLEMDLVKVIKK